MASTNTESCAKDDGPFRNERLSLGQTKAGTKSDSHSFHRQYMIHATMISLPAAPQHAPRKGARLLIARNFVFLSVGQVVVFSIGFITGIYSRRVLGVVAIGEVAWTMSVLSYFTLVTNPGLDTIAQRDVARDPSRGTEYVSKMLSLRMLLAIVSFLLVGLFAILRLRGPEISVLLVLQGISLLLEPLNLSWLLLARERMGAQALRNVAFQLLQLPALLLLVRGPADIVRYVLYPYPISVAGAIAIFWYTQSHELFDWRRLRITLEGTWLLIREAIPIGLSQAAILLYFNSSAIFLGFLQGNAAVGFYSTATRLWTYAIFPFSTLSQAYFPSLARASGSLADQQRTSSEFARLFLWFGLPVSAVCWALGRHIVLLFFGSQFAESGPLFEWLSLNVAMVSFTWGITYPLNAWGHQKMSLWITALGAVVNVGLNFVVIPRFGAPGAVATTLVTEGVILLAGLVVRRKICPLPWAALSWKPLATAAGTAVLVRCIVVAAPSYWWTGLLVGGAVCAAGLSFSERRALAALKEKIWMRYWRGPAPTGNE
jgi:O-antigen/teichoic acid export membrane protein